MASCQARGARPARDRGGHAARRFGGVGAWYVVGVMRVVNIVVAVLAGCTTGNRAASPRTTASAVPSAATPQADEPATPQADQAATPVAKPASASPDSACGSDLDACARRGAALHFGEGVARDPRGAERLLGAACDGGHAKACWLLAMGDESPAGFALMERACVGGAGMACRSLQFSAADGDGPAARRWAELGCQAGDAYGCHWLADRELDRGKRLAALVRACDVPWLDYDLELDGDDVAPKSENKACTSVARAYYDGHAGADAAAATRALEKLCDRGVPIGCQFAADRHMAGDGVPRSEPRALAFMDRACKLDDGGACYLLGRRLSYSGSTEDDRARAVRYLTIACEREVDDACDLLARVKR